MENNGTLKTKFNKINEILTCLNDINSASETEFEIRFGQFNKNKFFPKISLENFITSNSFLSVLCDTNVVQEYALIVNYRDSTRVTQILSTPKCNGILSYPWANADIIGEKIIKKQNIKNIDDHDYGIRYSLSKESVISDSMALYDTVNNPPVFFKTRKRITYLYRHMKIDISMFKSSDDINNLENSETRYDIEIELIDTTMVDLHDMFYLSEQILKIIQKTNIPMKFDEMVKVKERYSHLVKSKKFIGCQPETLTFTKVSRNTDYAMTIKLDGKRHLLFVDRGSVFLLDNKLNVVDFGIVTEDKLSDNFIIDGELLSNGVFYCFDILFYSNKDVRTLNLKERLTSLQDFVNNINNPNIAMKEYFFENLYSKVKNYITDTPVGTDGIILVPINKPYPETKNVNVPLKWKPEILNTIDLKIKKVKNVDDSDHEIWLLFCSGDHQFEYYGYTNLGITKIPIETALNYSDGSVVEFFFDKINEQFSPSKPRHDKIEGNFIEVAKDNFDTIMDSFDILSHFNQKASNKIQTSFFDMRRFHNWLKRSLLYKAVSSEPNNKSRKLLDLACGKGGDIHKWVDNNIRYVEGYDIDENSVNQAILRHSKVKQKPTSKNFDFSFNCLDLNKNTVPFNENNNFDIVTCFFAIHYFCESQQTLSNFISNFDGLKQNGIILITCLCSEKLKSVNYTYDSENLKITPVNSKSINVFIKNTVLDKPTEEYIVDSKMLIDTMASRGFSLSESKTFDEYYPLWKENENFLNYQDRSYSFLNRTYIFKKNSVTTKNNPMTIHVQSQQETKPVVINSKNSSSYEGFSLPELRKYCKNQNINIETLKTKKSILAFLNKK